jgi:hypothetical protein
VRQQVRGSFFHGPLCAAFLVLLARVVVSSRFNRSSSVDTCFYSPFVTGLIDKCEAAMSATDPSAAAAASATSGAQSRRQYVFSGELVRGTQFYGYSESETVFVRM